MPAGLQILDENVNLIIDYTTRVGRFLGSFTTSGVKSGSIQDSRLVGGNVITWPVDTLDAFSGAEITFNAAAGQINWSYNMTLEGQAVLPAYPVKKYYYGVY